MGKVVLLIIMIIEIALSQGFGLPARASRPPNRRLPRTAPAPDLRRGIDLLPAADFCRALAAGDML